MCSRFQLCLGDKLLLRRDRHVLDLQGGENRRAREGLLERCSGHSCCSEPPTHVHLLFHIPPSPAVCSEPTSWLPCQLQPSCPAPYLWLLEELAALLILDVGDLTILYLGTRAAVRLR